MSQKKNPNRFSRLLRYYATLILVLVFLLPLVAVYLLYQHNINNALAELNLMHYHIQSELSQADQDTQKIAQKLTESTKQIEALRHYANSSYQESLESFLMNRQYNLYLPDKLYRLHREFQDITSILIHVDNAKELIVSTADNTRGRKMMPSDISKEEGKEIGFDRPLFDLRSGHSLGQVQVNYHADRFFQGLAESPLLTKAQTVVVDAKLKRMLLERGKLSQDKLQAVIKGENSLSGYLISRMETGEDLLIISLLPKSIIWQRVTGPVLVITLITILVAVILLGLLYRFFGAYSNQVHDMVTTLKRIGEGQFYYRIRETDKQDELREITHSINTMLDQYQVNIQELYSMEAREHEAILKALQSQINPHFMYNTLEFIRMSALTEGADELADIVYDFAALLRNNISDEKETTLERELSFCRKYIHLYQVRYPNKLQVDIEMTSECQAFVLPKFTLQPLIENYFVHGVDFARSDNHLVIKAWVEGVADQASLTSRLWIEVSDNGRGMSPETLSSLNQGLREGARAIEPNGRQSIGIFNVAERLHHYFGGQATLSYQVNEEGGVRVWLKCPFNPPHSGS